LVAIEVMPAKPTAVLVVCLVLAMAGCTSTSGFSIDTSQNVTVPAEYEIPAPPTNLSTQAVEQAALEYEEAFLYRRLVAKENVNTINAKGTYGGRSATVINRNEGSVRIAVELGYAYAWGCGTSNSTGGNNYHGTSEATYRITTSDITRVDGTTISVPCV
jgi:hypothetical protein